MTDQTPLRDGLRRMLDRQRLDDRQYAALESLQASARQRHRPALSRRRFLGGVATAAGLVGVGFVSARWFLVADPTLEAVAADVLKNHLRLQPLDLRAGEIDALRGYFTLLDFEPSTARAFDPGALEMRGARYCSLLGVTAAQIVFDDPHGRAVTHYQARYVPEVFGDIPHLEQGQQPKRTVLEGVEITVSVEQNLLMALARDKA